MFRHKICIMSIKEDNIVLVLELFNGFPSFDNVNS